MEFGIGQYPFITLKCFWIERGAMENGTYLVCIGEGYFRAVHFDLVDVKDVCNIFILSSEIEADAPAPQDIG